MDRRVYKQIRENFQTFSDALLDAMNAHAPTAPLEYYRHVQSLVEALRVAEAAYCAARVAYDPVQSAHATSGNA